MKSRTEHQPAHSPGAQGHDATMRGQITKLQNAHADMMGNQANPTWTERVAQEPLTERLYDEQAPKTYASRQITGHQKGKNKGNDRGNEGRARTGDVGGESSY
jgi:hypothetical protein